jgi:hypothetical protein
LSARDDDGETRGHAPFEPLEPKASRPKPNARPGPGSIGNTVGLITPKPEPNGGIERNEPTRDANPPTAPETPQEVAVWDRIKGWVHTGLDVAGFIPGLGVVPDLAHAALYGLEGNKLEAVMAAVAAVPGAGDAIKAGSLAAKGGKSLGKDGGAHMVEEAGARAARERAEKALGEKAAREKAERETTDAGGGGRRDGGYSRANRMDPHEVPCFKKGKGNKASDEEYDRQLADQERALNRMTVEEYQRAREAYRSAGRDPRAGAEAARLREELHARTLQEARIRHVTQGIGPAEAAEAATREAAALLHGLDALHAPDLVAGGRAAPSGFGHPGANRSIGGQWPQSGRLDGLDRAAAQASAAYGQNAKINVRLRRCG